METTTTSKITVQNTINAPLEKVWNFWNGPEHITKWCTPTETWHTPYAENDLRVGGKILSRMEAKDGSMGFDFAGIYDEVTPNERLVYTLGDGRQVEVNFSTEGNQTSVVETFDPENENPAEFQKAGWQAILDSFKKYAEEN